MKLHKKHDKSSAASDPLKPKFPKITIDKNRRLIQCFTDGACDKNGQIENKGGWAYVIVENHQPKFENKGGVVNTTNNKMELQALIECLECLEENYPSNMQILVNCDSQYCVHGIQTWYKGWIAKDWKDVKNPEQWKRLIELKDKFTYLQFKWVRAHQELSGYNKLRDFEITWNAYVDQLAVEACTGVRQEDKPVGKYTDQQHLDKLHEEQPSDWDASTAFTMTKTPDKWIPYNELTDGQKARAEKLFQKIQEETGIPVSDKTAVKVDVTRLPEEGHKPFISREEGTKLRKTGVTDRTIELVNTQRELVEANNHLLDMYYAFGNRTIDDEEFHIVDKVEKYLKSRGKL